MLHPNFYVTYTCSEPTSSDSNLNGKFVLDKRKIKYIRFCLVTAWRPTHVRIDIPLVPFFKVYSIVLEKKIRTLSLCRIREFHKVLTGAFTSPYNQP